MINTSGSGSDNGAEDDVPPELEDVDPDTLKKEQEEMTDGQKQQKKAYQQMKKQFDTPAQAAEDDDEDEGCTVEEVKDDEPAQAAPAKIAQNPVIDTSGVVEKIN